MDGSVSGYTSFRKLTDSALSLNRYRERCYATRLSGGICGQKSEGQIDFCLNGIYLFALQIDKCREKVWEKGVEFRLHPAGYAVTS